MKPLSKFPIGVPAKALISVAASALCVLAFAPSAFACPYTGATQVFEPWGDRHSYVLAPDGGFEANGGGWSLAGGPRSLRATRPTTCALPAIIAR